MAQRLKALDAFVADVYGAGRAMAEGLLPRAAVSEGPTAAAWWEHSVLARELCAPAVTLDDLEVRDGRLVAWIDGRPHAVDVVYQRTAEDRFSGTPLELLVEPCARGALAVDDLVRFFLGEEPLLPSVRARPAGEVDDLEQFVVKPRAEMGGQDVVIWRDADERTRRRLREAIEREPNAYVAQELMTLSVHPTVCGGAKDTWVPA